MVVPRGEGKRTGWFVVRREEIYGEGRALVGEEKGGREGGKRTLREDC